MSSKTVRIMQAIKHQLSCICSGAIIPRISLKNPNKGSNIVNATFVASLKRVEWTV